MPYYASEVTLRGGTFIHYSMYSKEVYELLLPVTKCKSGTKKREKYH